MARASRFIVFAAVFALGATLLTARAPALPRATTKPRPLVLAYYYIWFDPTSWQRAKSDLPLLGPYSSDERKVIHQHVTSAKQAGIDGFLVSWKHTVKLDRRLQLLADEAAKQNFRLGIVYEGLDFERRPLPIARVRDDLAFFEKTFARQRPFALFEKPLVIWSGTWEFKTADIASVTRARRPHLLVLASEKSVKGYSRVGDIVDGNAYYWSSVDPQGHASYPEKLAAMSESVHQHHGLWIAPVAPGFDGKLLGHTRVVPRRGTATFDAEWNTAVQSSPDALGVISWNEFSENTYIEPSRNYGTQALSDLARLTGTPGPGGELDSSSPAGHEVPAGGIIALAFLALVLAGSAAVVGRRVRMNRRRNADERLSEGSL
jgi:hypothetical protein